MTLNSSNVSSHVGYARVSSSDQNLDLQRDALLQAGCHRVFEDKVSGVKVDRPGLTEALAYLRPGDTLVVWRLDRLGRSLPHLIATVQDLADRGISFMSLQEAIDTSTPGGNLVFQIFGALAEFERNLIRERTLAGLAAARARGRHGGRPPKLSSQKQELLFHLYDGRKHPVSVICSLIGISRSSVYGYLRARRSTTSNTQDT